MPNIIIIIINNDSNNNIRIFLPFSNELTAIFRKLLLKLYQQLLLMIFLQLLITEEAMRFISYPYLNTLATSHAFRKSE